jgi:hypothetical protein
MADQNAKIAAAIYAAAPQIRRNVQIAMHDIQAARAAVAKFVGQVPANMATDAATIYSYGLRQIGFTGPIEHPAAARTIFETLARNPEARRRMATDSAPAAAGFAKRFPNALPLKVV